MPHYHFNIRDGDELIEDHDGSILRDLDEAQTEALASAREMLAEKVRHGKVANGEKIEITDDDGTVLATVPLRDALKFA